MDRTMLEALTELDVGRADVIVTPSGEWADEADLLGYIIRQSFTDRGFRLWEIWPGDVGVLTVE